MRQSATCVILGGWGGFLCRYQQVFLYFFTQQSVLGRAGSWEYWGKVKKIVPLGKPSHKLLLAIESAAQGKRHYPHKASNAGQRSKSLSYGPFVLHIRVWGDIITTFWLWNFASTSEIFWKYRIHEIVHLDVLPEVGKFCLSPVCILDIWELKS